MQPTIIQKDEIKLVGMSFYGDPFETSAGWTEENQIGRLWQRFMTYLAEHTDKIQHPVPVQASYEVHVYGPETMTKGLFEARAAEIVARNRIALVFFIVMVLIVCFDYLVFVSNRIL